MSNFDDLNDWSDDILKGEKPPPGFTPVPGTSVGLWHKKVGDSWEYWKAKTQASKGTSNFSDPTSDAPHGKVFGYKIEVLGTSDQAYYYVSGKHPKLGRLNAFPKLKQLESHLKRLLNAGTIKPLAG